jgi:glutaredoxin
MNLILFTGNDCDPCHQVEESFRQHFKEELDSGEADIVNLDEDEGAQQFWMENELPVAPVVVVVSDQKKLVSVLDPSELLKKALPAEEPDKAATELSG